MKRNKFSCNVFHIITRRPKWIFQHFCSHLFHTSPMVLMFLLADLCSCFIRLSVFITCIIIQQFLQPWKKQWNNAICSNMDGLRDYHTKQNKKEKESKIWHKSTYLWNKNRLTDIREQNCGCQGVWKGRIGNLGLAEANYLYKMDKQLSAYCIAQGTIFNNLC